MADAEQISLDAAVVKSELDNIFTVKEHNKASEAFLSGQNRFALLPARQEQVASHGAVRTTKEHSGW